MGYSDQFGIFSNRKRTLKRNTEKEEWIKSLNKSKNYDKATKQTIIQTEEKSKKSIENNLYKH